jgi:hypothetical protein
LSGKERLQAKKERLITLKANPNYNENQRTCHSSTPDIELHPISPSLIRMDEDLFNSNFDLKTPTLKKKDKREKLLAFLK